LLDFRALLEARNTEIKRLNDIHLGMPARAAAGGMWLRDVPIGGGRVPLTAASGPVSGGRGSRIRSRGR
jgi:hypothetical protein